MVCSKDLVDWTGRYSKVMDDDDHFNDYDDGNEVRYKAQAEIEQTALNRALCDLHLLGDDPFLRMQAFNLSIVDQFITNLEYEVLRKLFDEERTPLPEASFLSAQSQMWIFAAYEIMRTWRQRTKDMIKWYDNGGLETKIEALEEDLGYKHFGRSIRASQIKKVLEDSSLIKQMRDDRRLTHMLYARLEVVRISLAKHELRGRGNSVALTPGYGRINQWCGSLDYELENGQHSMGYVNRRDIADDIRGLLSADGPPTDDEIASFDEYMRGPPKPPFE